MGRNFQKNVKIYRKIRENPEISGKIQETTGNFWKNVDISRKIQ
jgi:hypothetical protein